MACAGISGPSSQLACDQYQPNDANEVSLVFTESDYVGGLLTPGDYVFTYDVSIQTRYASFSFTVTLIDSCGSATLTSPTFSD